MTASVNKVLLVGKLGADPEVRYLPSATPVANLSLATAERRRQADGRRARKSPRDCAFARLV